MGLFFYGNILIILELSRTHSLSMASNNHHNLLITNTLKYLTKIIFGRKFNGTFKNTGRMTKGFLHFK